MIAGAAGGRRLAVPPGNGTRPTSDRAREGLFSTWEALLGTLSGIRVADLHAGSGAVGLEALSRGAAHALLVEADNRAARTVRENVRSLGLPGAEVRTGKAEQVVTGPAPASRTTWCSSTRRTPSRTAIFARYSSHSGEGWLADDAVVTVERSTRGGEFGWPDGFEALRARRYGEGTFWYGRAASTCEDAP